ncbi:MAG: hypothetical protein Q9191_007710 [Dirinaria sp. TL-2023a]
MLPSAKDYLVDGGLSPKPAAYATIGCFIGGVVGIQTVSRLMHHFIPSHVVDCDHTHDKHDDTASDEDILQGIHSHKHNGPTHWRDGSVSEDTPLLSRPSYEETGSKPNNDNTASEIAAPNQRPTFQSRLTDIVSGRKSCAQVGPCHGYSDLCAQECLKAIKRNPPPHGSKANSWQRPQFGLSRSTTSPLDTKATFSPDEADVASERHLSHLLKQSEDSAPVLIPERSGQSGENGTVPPSGPLDSTYDPESHHGHGHGGNPPHDLSSSHHHHVPENAFLAIGLQTSIAIALHKLPEGFITYATNHANPKLGFSVFMALFIHNITEGFAMALPLYLAVKSRWKAIFWSSLLGGVSQPLGAGIAALWFKAAGRGNNAPGQRVYGCMFAITAGIMASVALQLFSESLSMTHNRNLCVAFAFAGMAILGFSFALTAS